jgi:hypothetical protein
MTASSDGIFGLVGVVLGGTLATATQVLTSRQQRAAARRAAEGQAISQFHDAVFQFMLILNNAYVADTNPDPVALGQARLNVISHATRVPPEVLDKVVMQFIATLAPSVDPPKAEIFLELGEFLRRLGTAIHDRR